MTDRNEPLPKFLTPNEVATRWRVSLRTLEGWRFKGIGPTYTKIGKRVLYTQDAIERFEEAGVMLQGINHG